MKAAIVFAFSEVLAFTLWYVGIMPQFGVTCVVLGGCLAAFLVGNRSYPSKSLEELRRIPGGLGSDVTASLPPQGGDATIPVDIKQWAVQVREVTGGRQRNTALLALMKAIDQELSARIAGNEETAPLPASYDEPMACYPETMRHE